jgi:hypothetical protein
MPQEVLLSNEQQNLIQVIRANLNQGTQGSSAGKQLKEAADYESEMIDYIFEDPQKYLQFLITVMMDETVGRENVSSIIKAVNKTCPFLIMHDYRISQATNSLRRVEILQQYIKTLD